ncbi:hypothetical protein [Actinomyces bowdenii]|uniref:hypothetical protein n=1 Tax=Actinomyces bowdenii TaxID=131109 RepID=UPI00163A320C|nr:hypothetical protein [Actinomyces bowdenii]
MPSASIPSAPRPARCPRLGAVAAMREAGLTQVTDLGGIQEAASTTGLATVTEQ